MSSQPSTTDFLRQASNFVSYAAYLHFERYSVVYSMAPEASQAKEHVHWTDEEVSALIDYLYSKKSKADGAAFNRQIFQGAVEHIQPLLKQGCWKGVDHVKEKFKKVSW